MNDNAKAIVYIYLISACFKYYTLSPKVWIFLKHMNMLSIYLERNNSTCMNNKLQKTYYSEMEGLPTDAFYKTYVYLVLNIINNSVHNNVEANILMHTVITSAV